LPISGFFIPTISRLAIRCQCSSGTHTLMAISARVPQPWQPNGG
jgi:hypothetical protein